MVVCTLTSIVCGSAIYKDLFSSLRSMNISYTQYGALGSLLLWFTAWCEYLFNLAICSHGLHCPMLVTGILVLQRYFIQKINGSRVALTLDNKMYTCEKHENGKYVKKHVLELKKGDKVKISRFGICPKGKILSETAQLSHENITGDYDYKSFQYGEPCHAFSISQCDSLELEVIDSIELNDNMINQLEKKKVMPSDNLSGFLNYFALVGCLLVINTFYSSGFLAAVYSFSTLSLFICPCSLL